MQALGDNKMTTATLDAQVNARWIALWLAVCAATILGMILLGGVTRLTESGLSMVDWRPIMGVIPPLTEAQWLATFAEYQQYPEYQKINQGMDLAGFKQIFLFEYLHRVLGRLIGLMYFVPSGDLCAAEDDCTTTPADADSVVDFGFRAGPAWLVHGQERSG